jgi:hypothetical protein
LYFAFGLLILLYLLLLFHPVLLSKKQLTIYARKKMANPISQAAIFKLLFTADILIS